jgi:hypothetical protein
MIILPICYTSTSFSDLVGSINIEGNFFSTPNTTPSFVLIPIAVDPNFNQVFLIGKYILTFIASIAYSI